MRIKRVFVEKLFGLFDHQIPMNMDDRTTIIHAPNGFGKTTILRMIDGLFNSRYSELRTVPFSVFGVELEDGTTLCVEKRKGQESGEKQRRETPPTRSLVFSCGGETPYEYEPVGNNEGSSLLVTAVKHLIPHLRQVGPRGWQDSDDEILDSDQVVERYFDVLRDVLPHTFSERPNEPPWLREIKKSVDVRFVREDRLVARPRANRAGSGDLGSEPTSAVMGYAEELASAIGDTLTEYAELSQSLDRTFPGRLVDQSHDAELTKSEIAYRLSEFEAKRKRLTESGLLDQELDPQFQQIPGAIDDTKASVLSVYVCDVQKKLAVFDNLANKIDLLKSIINRRFRHKKIVISREKGITFTTDKDQPLAANKLSSGEQHEVVMLYELLFMVRPDSLILIDEPEISLHVAWQEAFLRDLQEMASLSSFDVLIATHSPQIISDRWDLTVELKDAVELQASVQ